MGNKTKNSKYKFERKNPESKISMDEYDDLFPLINDIPKQSKRERAWEKAWHVRDFEIKLYWERAKYFWAFIASTFAGFFVSLGDSSNKITELPFIMIIIGFIFSLAWLLVNIGSKNWQKNWETHIDNLEEEFTGPLYRTVIIAKNYSVSKINIIISSFIIVIWFLLGIVFIIDNDKNLNWFIIIFTMMTAIIFSIILLKIGQTGRSKKKNNFKIRK